MNQELKELIIKICITIGIVAFLLFFVVGVHVYHKNNMAPSIRDGDLVITYKLNKGLYSDTVVSYKGSDGTRQFGRIVGVPDDEIIIDEKGNFTINGNIPLENVYYNTFPDTGITYPYKVPENSYFILNDYRDDKKDSRQYGAIEKKKIEGQVFFQLRRRGF